MADEGGGNGNGGNGNGGDKGWKETLPEDIRSHPSLETFKGVEDLAKSYVNAQKLIGKEKLPLPSGPDDAETWKTVYARLGRPESVEGYSLKTDNIPTELPVDENFLTNFKNKALELNLLPTQVQGLFDWWIEVETGIMQELDSLSQTEREKTEAELRREWGKAYDQNAKLASSVFAKFGGKYAKEFDSKYGNDPVILSVFSAIGKAMSEDNLLGEPPGPTMTPTEAQTEINKIQGDLKHPYHVGDHPEHAAAVAYMQSLYKMVYPEGKKE